MTRKTLILILISSGLLKKDAMPSELEASLTHPNQTVYSTNVITGHNRKCNVITFTPTTTNTTAKLQLQSLC